MLCYNLLILCNIISFQALVGQQLLELLLQAYSCVSLLHLECLQYAGKWQIKSSASTVTVCMCKMEKS